MKKVGCLCGSLLRNVNITSYFQHADPEKSGITELKVRPGKMSDTVQENTFSGDNYFIFCNTLSQTRL